MTLRAWCCACLIGLVACDDDQQDTAEIPPPASASGSTRAAFSEGPVLPPPRPHDSDPLDLGPSPATVSEGQRVFAVPPEILATAALGKALTLRGATVLGMDGEDILVRVAHGESYAINAHYLVVPQPGRFERGGQLIAAYKGRMEHAVAKLLSGDKVVVQFTDLGFKLADQKLEPASVGVLAPGLTPGAYAVHRSGGELRHVTLISAVGDRWLCMAYDGIASLVAAAELERLPRPRFDPKVGQEVMAMWRGAMVRAELRALERPGLYTVKRPRATAPEMVGPAMLMPVE